MNTPTTKAPDITTDRLALSLHMWKVVWDKANESGVPASVAAELACEAQRAILNY